MFKERYIEGSTGDGGCGAVVGVVVFMVVVEVEVGMVVLVVVVVVKWCWCWWWWWWQSAGGGGGGTLCKCGSFISCRICYCVGSGGGDRVWGILPSQGRFVFLEDKKRRDE